MTYAELSAADQQIVDNTVNLIRASCGETAKVFNHLKAIADDDNAIALVLSIDAAEVIPNTSGLAGSAPLNKSDHVKFVTQHFNKLLEDASAYTTGFNTASQRQQRVAAAGPTNTVI